MLSGAFCGVGVIAGREGLLQMGDYGVEGQLFAQRPRGKI